MNSTGQGWRLNKEISLGDLIAFGTALCAVMYSYFTLDKRLSVAEDMQHQQIARDLKQDEERLELKHDIVDTMKTIDQKLTWVLSNRLPNERHDNSRQP